MGSRPRLGFFAVAVHLDLKLHSLWGFGFSVCGNVAVHVGVIGASWLAVSGLVLGALALRSSELQA